MRKLTLGTLPCLVHAPADWNGVEPRPLLLFLHGIGERAAEEHPDALEGLDRLLVHSIPYLADAGLLPTIAGRAFPFVVLCPQTARTWRDDAESVHAAIDACTEAYAIDVDRCYATGLSMGGTGVWHVAAARPARFAALVALSGAYPGNGDADRAQAIPARVYVGERDERADGIVEAAIRRGDCFVVTEGERHTGDYWNRVYTERTLYQWLLAQRRSASPAP